MEGSNDRGAGGEFHERLQELKEQGSAILVVGEVPSSVRDAACDRLLGEDAALPRHRLQVFTNGRGKVQRRIQAHSHGPGSTEAITAAVTRSVASESVTADVPVTELDPDSLAELGGAISTWVQETENRQGTLAHGELRLCVDSLLPLLQAHGDQEVFEFVVLTGARVRAVSGMGHFHLPVARDSRIARLLTPAADAVIELRTDATRPQQRWHLVEADVTSQWLSL